MEGGAAELISRSCCPSLGAKMAETTQLPHTAAKLLARGGTPRRSFLRSLLLTLWKTMQFLQLVLSSHHIL